MLTRSSFQSLIAREAERYWKLGAGTKVSAMEVFELLQRIASAARETR
jgi:hypothetical protein